MAQQGVNIPLAIGAYTRASGYEPRSIFKNMMVEKDISGAGNDQVMRIQRPGMTLYQTVSGTGACRGIFYQQGLLGSLPVAAIGTQLIKFTTSTNTVLGTIVNDGNSVEFAATNFGLACLSGGTVYFYDTSLHTIAIPNFLGSTETPVSICSINSYVIIACQSGLWCWLEPGSTTIDALHFATAESMPDNLVSVHQLHDEVFFFGTQSMEVWQVTGDPSLILARANGRTWDRGLIGRDTLANIDNTAMFVGDNGQVLQVDTLPLRISNSGIEERLRNRTGSPSAHSFTYDGHAFYALYVPGQGTFVYDVLNQNWSEFASDQLSYGWLARYSCMMGSTVLCGDSTTGKVFYLDSSSSADDGTIFTRAVSGVVPFNGGRQRNDSIELWVGALAPIVVRLRIKDGLDTAFGSYQTATSNYPDDIVRWTRLGAARQPNRCIEFSTVDAGFWCVSGATANGGRAW